MLKYSYNEQELLSRLAEGNRETFNTIYNTYYQQLVYFAITLIQNHQQSEDIATEAFVKAWNARTTFKSEAHIKSYLFLSVKHSCLDYIRSTQTHHSVHQQLQYLAEGADNHIERAMAQAELIREIARQVEELPAQCGRVFKHLFFDGMTTEEVATTMGISTKNVLNQKSIAIKQIRMRLLKKGLFAAVLFLENFFS